MVTIWTELVGNPDEFCLDCSHPNQFCWTDYTHFDQSAQIVTFSAILTNSAQILTNPTDSAQFVTILANSAQIVNSSGKIMGIPTYPAQMRPILPRE